MILKGDSVQNEFKEWIEQNTDASTNDYKRKLEEIRVACANILKS